MNGLLSKAPRFPLLLVLCWPAAPIFAQGADEAAGNLEEVIVTARKREESLQEVPLTISAFSAQDILEADIRNLESVSNYTPGFQFVNQGNQQPGRYNTQLRFRGLTTAQFSPSFATGALFIDGIYVLNGGTSLSLMDVERVEVIKGPQSAYFGRNTFGGAVNLITRDPDMEEFSGEVLLRATDRGNNEINAFLEGPIVTDKLSFSLGGRLYDKKGHYVANDGGRTGNEETTAINAVLKWQATENLSFKARYGYSEDDDGPPSQAYVSGLLFDSCTGKTIDTAEGPANPTNYICGQVPYTTGIPGQPGTGEISSNTVLPAGFQVLGRDFTVAEGLTDPNLTLAGVPRVTGLGLKREVERFSFFGEYEFENGYSIDFNYGKNKQQANWIRDFDNSDRIGWFSRDPQDMEDESYEVRLSSPTDQRFRWLIGYNEYEQEFTSSGGGGDATTSCFATVQFPPSNNYPADCVGGIPGIVNFYFPNNLQDADRADVKGIFASVDFDITDQWTAIFEGRWQKDKLTKGGGLVRPNEPVLSESFDDFLPRIILRWQPGDETNLWVNYSEGQIAGEFNTNFINADDRERAQYLAQDPNIAESLDAETLEAWEIGWKQGFMDGRGQFNLAFFHYEWENIKGRSSFRINETCKPQDVGVLAECNPDNGIMAGDPKQIPGPDGELVPFFNARNILLPGDSTIKGAELELWYAFTEALSAQVGVSYIDSEYDDYDFNFVASVAGFSQMAGKSDASPAGMERERLFDLEHAAVRKGFLLAR